MLVLFCHPMRHKSRVNRALAARAATVPGVTVHDLYEAYPDFAIDVEAEQALLASHDVIVWQHPLYWYSTPALLKEWQDLVLQRGWAYGAGGMALRGKRLLSAISTGGPAEAYTEEGMHGIGLLPLLAPVRQTARLCGMTWLPPFVVHGSHRLSSAEIDEAATQYAALLAALHEGRFVPAVGADGGIDVQRAIGEVS